MFALVHCSTRTMADMAKLAPAFAKLAEAAQEISDIFAGGGVLGKRAGEYDENGKKKKKEKRAPRPPTAFNLFMKKAVAETKQEQIARQLRTEEEMNPKQIFAHCAAKWKNSPDNPKSEHGSLGSLANPAKPKTPGMAKKTKK